MAEVTRTPVRKKAAELAKLLKKEKPDYDYLKQLFRHLRAELDVVITPKSEKLPYVPTEEEIRKYYQAVWQSRNMKHVLMIKTLLYTGVRVSEFVHIQIRVQLHICPFLGSGQDQPLIVASLSNFQLFKTPSTWAFS